MARAGRLLCALVLLAVASSFARSAEAGDPKLEWWTLESPRFRVHFHGGLELLAQRVAAMAERAHAQILPELGAESSELTQIVLTDEVDEANGLASVRPYRAIRLLVSAPDDMSPLANYDDWHDQLVTHEYTHVLQIDDTSGLPALLNAVLGKLYTPNDWQPRFLLEGIAIVMESKHTSAGRLRGSDFDMFLRADVLDDRFVPLDQVSHEPRRFPHASVAYTYGAHFVSFIAETYGTGTFGAVARDYGASVIPFGINRAIRRATGRTYPELYGAFRREVEAKVRRTVESVRARGLREGKRLTRSGGIARAPRYLPSRCAPGKVESLVYFRDDGHDPEGLYVLAPGSTEPQLLTRAFARAPAVAPDCAILFDSQAPSRRRHVLSDLFELAPGSTAESGFESERERLTIGRRAREPAVSPDGRSVAYVTNHAGTTTLRVAERTKDGLRNERRLVPSARYEQAYTPRFSPDGTRVAYSAWTQGGFRDIRIADVQSGEFIELSHDRALDRQPAWSPDGKTLYFSSDRSGIANIYAYSLETRSLRQVTNVLTGAFYPEVSADGRTLVYVGYGSFGFDLFSMPLDPSRFLEAEPAPEAPLLRGDVPLANFPVRPYTALPTLRPFAYRMSYGTGTFGNALTVQTVGADALGRHAFTASLTLESEGEWQGFVDYRYGRLPFDLHALLFRNVSPRADYRVGATSETVTEELVALTTGINVPIPGEFSQESLGLSYTIGSFSHDAPFDTRADPWEPMPIEPPSGVIATARLGYNFSSAAGSRFGISPERGVTLSLGIDVGDPAIGSESTLRAVQGSLASYFELPWFDHHVLALAVSGASAGGSYSRRGLYSTGGFAERPPLEAYASGLLQSGFVLRGYEPGQFTGNEYALFNAEYRFPLLTVDRGISTLPVFLDTVSAAVFADYGGAYNAVDPDDPLAVLHAGIGGELWFSLTLAYQFEATLRLGAARGLDDHAPSGFQTYFVAASGF